MWDRGGGPEIKRYGPLSGQDHLVGPNVNARGPRHSRWARDALAGRAHGEGGWRGHLHVELR